MSNVEASNRRSFALVGHTGDGKTSLGEALLHHAKATANLGVVDAGSSCLDFAPEETERRHTLSSSVFSFEWQDHALTLVDTPGDPNFQADGQVALGGLDGAVLVVSAVDGAKVGTETMWRAVQRHGVPALGFVNGMDRDRADFDGAVESLGKMESCSAIAIALPIGAGPDFKGIVDLRTGRAIVEGKACDPPADLADAVKAAQEQLVEAVAECDDHLLERYLEEGELGEEEIAQGLIAGVRAGRLLPVLCGAATSEIGAEPLLRAIADLLPGPADRPAPIGRTLADGSEVELAADPSAPFAGIVLKTIVDRYAGTLSVIRVISGTLHGDSAVHNATHDARERVGKLLALRGAEHAETGDAGPGDVVAVAKLKHTHTGDALCQEKNGARVTEIPIPEGVLSYAISAKTKGDEDKLFSSLARLVEEDPSLGLGRDAATGEFLLTGMGELHIRVTAAKLHRLYDVDVELKTPKVPYRETVRGKADHVEGKLKKQSGGKGMYGVCYLTLEPLPRGEGIQFVDEIVGGAIPRNLIPAVEKGIREASAAGPLAGYPVVDIRVRCTDGKFHSVDSNEMAFKIAGSMGFKTGVEQARPTLLEPIMNAEIGCPEESVGDIMGDISGRRGRVQTSEVKGSSQVIKAQVPMAEMLEYASALTSLTGGKGAFHMEFSHYDEVPAQVRDKIIAEAKAERAEDS